MRQLKTPMDIVRDLYGHEALCPGWVHASIIAAQRDAFECAAANVKVYSIKRKEYHHGKIILGYKIDKSTILNLLPKEI